MARLWKRSNHLHLGIGLGVGRIDDAEFGLASRNEGKRAADIVCLRELRFDACKDPERFESFLGVHSARTRVHAANSDPAIARGAREIETFRDLKLAIGVAWLDEDKLIAKKIPACSGADELGLFEVIHPFEVGGNKYIRRGALRDLFRKDCGGRVSDRHGLAGIGFPGGGGGIESGLHAGRLEDDGRGGGVRRDGGHALAAKRASRKEGPNRQSEHQGAESTPRGLDRQTRAARIICQFVVFRFEGQSASRDPPAQRA